MHHVLRTAALALLLAGCGKTTVSLSSHVGSSTAGSALTAAGGVTLTRVRIVVEKIELEGVATMDGGTRVEREFEAGPYLIDLQGAQLEGGINKLFTIDIEPGVYREVKFKIHKLGEAQANADPKFVEMKNLSIRVEGTRNGTAFTFDSALDEEQEREGDFTVKAGDNNIDLNINPAGWFMNGNTPLDPSDPSARSRIESNIKASIEAFKDDDHHGHRS
jgi:hypothetical protein